MNIPLEKEGYGRKEDGGDGLAIENEDIVVHSAIERSLGEEKHAGVNGLNQNHSHERSFILIHDLHIFHIDMI